jgi:hypothetical protein
VVALTPDLDRTTQALEAAGLDLRRVRDAGERGRQAFFHLSTALLEVGQPASGLPAGEPARFWGLVVVVEDLDRAAEAMGDRLGEPRDAVQPGRRIATVRSEAAGLSVALALMTPRTPRAG